MHMQGTCTHLGNTWKWEPSPHTHRQASAHHPAAHSAHRQASAAPVLSKMRPPAATPSERLGCSCPTHNISAAVLPRQHHSTVVPAAAAPAAAAPAAAALVRYALSVVLPVLFAAWPDAATPCFLSYQPAAAARHTIRPGGCALSPSVMPGTPSPSLRAPPQAVSRPHAPHRCCPARAAAGR